MQFELNTTDLRRAFSALDSALMQQQFLKAAGLANRLMPIDHKIYVTFWAQEEQPAWGRVWGMAACAPTFDLMSFTFHPDHFHLRSNENNGIARYSAVIAHELHHNNRWLGPGYGQTLGQMMVSEGLALKFQRETGHPDFPEERQTSRDTLHDMAERAKPLLGRIVPEKGDPVDPDLQVIDHYCLGLHIIESWSRYSGITAAAAHALRAEEILEPWLAGKFHIVSPAYTPS